MSDLVHGKEASLRISGRMHLNVNPSHYWLILSEIGHIISSSVANNLHIECLADMYRASGNAWIGYSVKGLSLNSLGRTDFMIAFPSNWKLQECCHKIQLRFSERELLNRHAGQSGILLG